MTFTCHAPGGPPKPGRLLLLSSMTTITLPQTETAPVHRDAVFDIADLSVRAGQTLAVGGVSLQIYKNAITALIGPSGCGKSTVLRCLNRMNDLVSGARVEGKVNYHGVDLYSRDVSATEVRRR